MSDGYTAEERLVSALTTCRIMQRITQAELAERIGVSRSNIARFEGGYSSPTLRRVLRYADAVGADLEVYSRKPLPILARNSRPEKSSGETH
jgi:transcriptional regulator with XRE-family HTH domain